MATQTVTLESEEQKSILVGALSPTKSRLLYIDNLRTVIITFVVLAHLSITYLLDAEWVYYEIGEFNPVFILLQLIIMVIGLNFALPLFFMIAGYFTPPAYDRKGVKRFVVDRFKRLGIPWLIFEIFINPFIHYAVDVHGGNCKGALYDCQYQGTFWQYLKEFPRLSGSIGDGPVWFLEALLIFSIFYALWRMIADREMLSTYRARNQSYALPSNKAIALFALVIGLSSFFIRFWFKAFIQYEPLHLEFARFPQYIALFITGVWAYRGNWLVEFTDRQAKTWFWVALGCILILPVLMVWFGALSGTLDERATGGVNWLSLAYSIWEGFMCVSLVITLLIWFRRRFDHQGRPAQIMSKTSFAVYIIHPAIIVPLALALSNIQMNKGLKFLFVAPIAIVLCYLIAYGLLKVPVVKTALG